MPCALFAALLGAPAAGAAVDPADVCAKHASRYRLLQQTRFGVLFVKETPRTPLLSTTYGCLFSTQRARALPEARPSSAARLDGRYAAFFTVDATDALQPPARLKVKDLRTGAITTDVPIVSPADGRLPGSPRAGSIVVRGDGAVGWTAGLDPGYGRPVEWEVQRVGAQGAQARTLDCGAGVDSSSLRKSRDERIVLWRHGPSTRSAPLGG